MVKPVFRTLSLMKEVETANQAEKIAVEFLSSPAAKQVNRAQAGTFLKEVEIILSGHGAPNCYENVLLAAKAQGSTDLKELAGYALIDFSAISQHIQQASPFLQRNVEILAALRKPEPGGFSFAMHSFEESVHPDYPQLLVAQNGVDLKSALNTILLENEIGDEEAAAFLNAVTHSFKRLGIPSEEQIELLGFIQDGTGKDQFVHQQAIERANNLVNASQGPTPRSADNRGRDFGIV